MCSPALAVRRTVGTYQYLHLAAQPFGYLFEDGIVIIEIVVEHYKGIVLFKLSDKVVKVPYLLAGG